VHWARRGLKAVQVKRLNPTSLDAPMGADRTVGAAPPVLRGTGLSPEIWARAASRPRHGGKMLYRNYLYRMMKKHGIAR
jgi:hypothetical protein